MSDAVPVSATATDALPARSPLTDGRRAGASRSRAHASILALVLVVEALWLAALVYLASLLPV